MKTEKRKNYVTIGEFVAKGRKRAGKAESGMGREKRMAATLGLVVVLGMTGCAGTANTQKEVPAETENQQPDGGTDMPDMLEGEWRREELAVAQENEPDQSAENSAEESEKPENNGQSVRASEGSEYLGGKVQNPRADGMTLAQTTLTDEDGMVTLLDVKDAKKIPVKFTADTKVEHWTIQEGGAGIDMREAAVSDLEEGMGVELEGYFDGETFVAVRVIMEEYV